MESTGILQRLQKHAWPLEGSVSQQFYKEVTIEKVIPIHAVLVMGIALSIIVYIVEVIHFNYSQHRKEKDSDVDLNEFHERFFFSNSIKYLNDKKYYGHNKDDFVKHRKKILFTH